MYMLYMYVVMSMSMSMSMSMPLLTPYGAHPIQVIRYRRWQCKHMPTPSLAPPPPPPTRPSQPAAVTATGFGLGRDDGGAARSRKLDTDPDLSILRRPQPAEGETVYAEDLGLPLQQARPPLRQQQANVQVPVDEATADAEVSAVELRRLSIIKTVSRPDFVPGEECYFLVFVGLFSFSWD